MPGILERLESGTWCGHVLEHVVIELLNLANANQYYANHCRWARRRYGKWQNTDAAREERALDPLTREPVDPFRNHMRVKVDEVVQVAVGVLNEPNQDVVA